MAATAQQDVRVDDVRIGGEAAWLVQGDFFIADMTALELHRAAGQAKEIHVYEADHGVRHPQARADRLVFLQRTLSL